MIDLFINHDCKTSCGLIRDGLFTNWKFGFVFDPRLHDLKLLVLELFHFASLFKGHYVMTHQSCDDHFVFTSFEQFSSFMLPLVLSNRLFADSFGQGKCVCV